MASEALVQAVRHALEVKGVLPRLRAELRFAVCSVVDDAERGEREYHVPDSSLFAVKHEPLVRTAMWLLLNFLDAYQLSSTKQCLLAEMGLTMDEQPLRAEVFNSVPLLAQLPAPSAGLHRSALVSLLQHVSSQASSREATVGSTAAPNVSQSSPPPPLATADTHTSAAPIDAAAETKQRLARLAATSLGVEEEGDALLSRTFHAAADGDARLMSVSSYSDHSPPPAEESPPVRGAAARLADASVGREDVTALPHPDVSAVLQSAPSSTGLLLSPAGALRSPLPSSPSGVNESRQSYSYASESFETDERSSSALLTPVKAAAPPMVDHISAARSVHNISAHDADLPVGGGPEDSVDHFEDALVGEVSSSIDVGSPSDALFRNAAYRSGVAASSSGARQQQPAFVADADELTPLDSSQEEAGAQVQGQAHEQRDAAQADSYKGGNGATLQNVAAADDAAIDAAPEYGAEEDSAFAIDTHVEPDAAGVPVFSRAHAFSGAGDAAPAVGDEQAPTPAPEALPARPKSSISAALGLVGSDLARLTRELSMKDADTLEEVAAAAGGSSAGEPTSSHHAHHHMDTASTVSPHAHAHLRTADEQWIAEEDDAGQGQADEAVVAKEEGAQQDGTELARATSPAATHLAAEAHVSPVQSQLSDAQGDELVVHSSERASGADGSSDMSLFSSSAVVHAPLPTNLDVVVNLQSPPNELVSPSPLPAALQSVTGGSMRVPFGLRSTSPHSVSSDDEDDLNVSRRAMKAASTAATTPQRSAASVPPSQRVEVGSLPAGPALPGLRATSSIVPPLLPSMNSTQPSEEDEETEYETDFEDDASTSVLSLPLASSSRAAVHSNRGTSAAVQGEADTSHEDSIPLDEDIEEDVLDTTTGGSFSARGVEAAAAAGAPRVFQVSLNSATSPQRTAAAAVAATAAPADADEEEDDDLYGGFY